MTAGIAGPRRRRLRARARAGRETGVLSLSPGTDILGYNMAEDEEKDRYIVAGSDTALSSGSYVTGGGGMTFNFPSDSARP